MISPPRLKSSTSIKTRKLLARKKGVMLDISFGGKPQARSITLGPDGDIKHNPCSLPLPLPKECVHTAVVTHVLEYLEPSQFFNWFDELWRIMQPMGTVYVSGPYGGDDSFGWLTDPTHKTRVLEQSFAWLDPRTPLYKENEKVGRKIPKPWYPMALARVPGTDGTISYNCVLQRRVEP